MINTKSLKKNLLVSALILLLSSCATANSPSAVNAECGDLNELMKFAGNNSFFDQQPQDLLKNTSTFLTTTKDVTVDKGIDRSIRTINGSGTRGKWLNSAIIKYRIPKGQQAEFSSAVFSIAQSCFAKPDDLLALAANNIASRFDDLKMPPPDAYTLRSWTLPDTDPDMVRAIEIIASSALLEIKIKREPAPTQP